MSEAFNKINIRDCETKFYKNENAIKSNNIEVVSTFCLVRHGCTDYNVENRLQGWMDVPLNEEGRRQAKELAFSINKKCWDVVISSDLIRAKQTAEIISEALNSPLFLFKGLRERNFGIYEGKLIQEIEEMKLESNNSNMESEEKDNFILRINKSFDILASVFKGQRIIVVSHGGVLKNFLKVNVGYYKEAWQNTEFVSVVICNGNWVVCSD
jgi:broad specificity phosphatase PhoE